MKDLGTIIIRPLISEKTMAAAAHNKYVFRVAKDSNKIEIGQAISRLYKVDVVKVNTLIVKGSSKRLKTGVHTTPSWKKAYVTIKAGQSIPVFEGM